MTVWTAFVRSKQSKQFVRMAPTCELEYKMTISLLCLATAWYLLWVCVGVTKTQTQKHKHENMADMHKSVRWCHKNMNTKTWLTYTKVCVGVTKTGTRKHGWHTQKCVLVSQKHEHENMADIHKSVCWCHKNTNTKTWLTYTKVCVGVTKTRTRKHGWHTQKCVLVSQKHEHENMADIHKSIF